MELSNKLSVTDIADNFKDKRVFIRVDFNVPLKDGIVADKTRIVASIPSIKYVIEHGAKSVILASHLGRPDGIRNEKYSLKPVVEILNDLLNTKVQFLNDCIGEEVENVCLNGNGIILLENLRFHIEEEGKGINEYGEKVKATTEQIKLFRDSLTKLADIYVNDAFGTAHRAHSSMVGLNLQPRVAGLLLKKELEYFGKALNTPNRPFLAILGGAKVADKIQLIKNLLSKVDTMIIAGGMAFTFKKVLDNMQIGNSLFDQNGAEIVKDIMDEANQKNVKIVLPTDFVIGDSFSANANARIVNDTEGIQDGWIGLDIGPDSVEKAKQVILASKTIIANGPPGVFEMEKFSKGSTSFVEAIIAATKLGSITIVGGGDTASLFEMCNASSQVSHVSTGGGASLELLEGKQLPGVSALSTKPYSCD